MTALDPAAHWDRWWHWVMVHWQQAVGWAADADPLLLLLFFAAGSVAMIWRLGALERKGLEGTALGTVIMPYASGFSNLMFAFILGRSGDDGILVLENCLVNNVTNLTLLIGLPAVFSGLAVFPDRRGKGTGAMVRRSHRLNHLSLQLTLVAVLFFTGTLWALAGDGVLDFREGLVLVGMFFFWQLFQLYDVLKQNVYRGRRLQWSMLADGALVLLAGVVVYQAIDGLVAWVPRTGPGVLVFDNIGWLSGLLMVIPNALLAFYYAARRRADIVYSSQVGDGHICIPMCIGLFALFSNIRMPAYFELGVAIIMGAAVLHLALIGFWGRLPRLVGLLLTGAYGYFLFKGIIL